ncbi:MAG: M61 family metallopeptidase [Planctomycetes bacterium]|nr:M61 family metallopeptidase [Planctomycetota bacterium]
MLHCLAAALTLLAPQIVDTTPGPVTADYVVQATTVDADDKGRIPLTITLRLSYPRGTWTVFELPHWTPGSYRLRDFPDRIHDVRALDADERQLEVVPLRRGAFGIAHPRTDWLMIEYRIDLADDDRFMQEPPGRRCITYEGPQVYVYPTDAKDAPCRVRFDIPDDWRVATGLVARRDGSYFARDYDFLADCPVKLGEFEDWTIQVAGTPIRVVVDTPRDSPELETADWLANIGKICAAEADLFGGMPFDTYTFLFTAGRLGRGGGLEHLTSTAIGLRLASLQRGDRAGLSTIAHEFFHAWNVKRARPAALGPFDYARPNRTTMLWLCEGVTSYYTSVMLARAGLSDETAFWRGMAGRIGAFESSAARPHVSSAEASWTVWDDRPADRQLDYYTSGQVLGLLLDVRIRALTHNHHSLDDLLRNLYQQCATTGLGFQDADVERHLLHLTGEDFTRFFDEHVRGTQVPDYPGILAGAGVRYREERRSEPRIRGLTRIAGDDGVLPYWSDPEGGSASQQGIVLAIDGQPIDAGSAGDAVAKLTIGGDATLLLAAPGGRQLERRVTVDRAASVRVTLTVDPDGSESAAAIRRGIVTGPIVTGRIATGRTITGRTITGRTITGR